MKNEEKCWQGRVWFIYQMAQPRHDYLCGVSRVFLSWRAVP